MINKELFYCYSRALKDYLDSKDIAYRYFDVHTGTKKLFWVYLQNDVLGKALTEFSKQNAKV